MIIYILLDIVGEQLSKRTEPVAQLLIERAKRMFPFL